jgi:hypothetical protein
VPRRPAREAADEYIKAVRHILLCITDAPLLNTTSRNEVISPHILYIPNGPVRLDMQDAQASRIALDFLHEYQVVRRPHGDGWDMVTTGYNYSFRLDGGPEVLAYHWHHDLGEHYSFPHVHLKQGSEIGYRQLQKAHLPTGLVSPKEIVQLAHDGLGVAWRREGCEEELK